MKIRSPCFGCERLNQSKHDCSNTCKTLHSYQESLPKQLVSSSFDVSENYKIPHTGKTEPDPQR